MPTKRKQRRLVVVVAESRAGVGRVEILEVVAGMVILDLRKKQESIADRELILEGGVPVHTVEAVVDTNAVVVLIIHVQRISEAPVLPELGGLFTPLPVTAIFGEAGQGKPVALEQPGVFLLRRIL